MNIKKIVVYLKKNRICCWGLEQFLRMYTLWGAINKNELKIYKGQKKVFFLLSPTHGNLGDNAIADATKEFVKDELSNYKLMEYTILDSVKNIRAINDCLEPGDIILLHGGGNLGDMYKVEEYSRRIIINGIKKENKIISMPQTMNFSQTKMGKREYKRTQKIYSANKNLVLTAREKTTLELMKQAFPSTKIIYSPDIVLYLNKKNDSIERKNILVCLRNDEEGVISQLVKNSIKKILENNFDNIEITDTVLNHGIPLSERDERLNEIWSRFSASQVVITDRLHGMIFCAITATPCIVLKTFNHKVVESYNWLKDCEYIKMAEENTPECIEKMVRELISFKDVQIKKDFRPEYEELLRCLRE